MSKVYKIFAGVSFFILIAGGLYFTFDNEIVTSRTGSNTANKISKEFSLPAFKDDVAKCESADCVYDLFTKVTKEHGARLALDVLSGDVLDGSLAPCHQVAHVIGKSAIESVSDVEKNLAIESYLCTFGFQHGVIEGAGERLSEKEYLQYIPKFCNTFDVDNLIFACLHGLGHALVVRFDGDLSKAADGCLLYEAGPGRFFCFDGAVMQWSDNVSREDISGFIEEYNGKVERKCDEFLKDNSLYSSCVRNIWLLYQNPDLIKEINDPVKWWQNKLDFCGTLKNQLIYCVEGINSTVSNQILTGEYKGSDFANFCDKIATKYIGMDGREHCEFHLVRWPMTAQVDTNKFLPVCEDILGVRGNCQRYVNMLFEEMRESKDPRAI